MKNMGARCYPNNIISLDLGEANRTSFRSLSFDQEILEIGEFAFGCVEVEVLDGVGGVGLNDRVSDHFLPDHTGDEDDDNEEQHRADSNQYEHDILRQPFHIPHINIHNFPISTHRPQSKNQITVTSRRRLTKLWTRNINLIALPLSHGKKDIRLSWMPCCILILYFEPSFD